MMGERLVMQESLFYAFRLEDHVPSDHLLRRIDRFVDCSGLRQAALSAWCRVGRAGSHAGSPTGRARVYRHARRGCLGCCDRG